VGSIFNLSKSIFNFSKSILKAWEAFSIFRKAFSKREKHSQFFEKRSHIVRSTSNSLKSILKAREAFSILWEAFSKSKEAFLILDGGIRKNLRKGILKAEKAFSTLDEAFEKNETFQFRCSSFWIFTKSFLNWTRKRRARKKALQIYLDGILKTLIVSVSVAMIFSPKPRKDN
jgi:hypothetical protein